MNSTLPLGRFSLGVGDRFGLQAKAQLQACRMAAERGVTVVPVWNKSNREHNIIGSEPTAVRAAADAAARQLGWTAPYYVDADHINLATVDRFIDASDFYTLDVAEYIGRPVTEERMQAFLAAHGELTGCGLTIRKYLGAVEEAGRIYRRIAARREGKPCIIEVSMDETDEPQSPPQLLVILAAIAAEGIPVQTIAPRFTGRFNKGVDYVGDVARFEREFRDDVAVIACAVPRYGLPADLKLSVHSGSDKFAIYGFIRRVLEETGAGVHVKTAGTTWLEELIGLAEADAEGLGIAKAIYAEAWLHRAELCGPYAAVIDIDPSRLPSPDSVRAWTSEQFTSALRHDQSNPAFNPDLRQLLHVGYKIAAAMGPRYLEAVAGREACVSRNVTANLFERHIRPLFC